VGHLLGLYAMISPLEWRSGDKSVCRSCTTKDCVAKKNQYRLTGRSCTSNLYPAAIGDNRQCLMCTQCLKACPNGNLRLSIRPPFADFFRSVELRWAEVGFILLVSGFVVYEILSEWSVSKSILTWIPAQVAGAIGASGWLSGFIAAVILFIVFPAALFLLTAIGARAISGTSAKASLQSLALLLLPTMAAAHIFKSLLKMNTRMPYWWGALSDPAGVSTAQKIAAGALKLDKSLVTALDPAVTAAAVVLLLAALLAILLILAKSPALRNAGRGTKAVLLTSAVLYWAIFAVTTIKWRL
jgi:ferredoxin